MNETSIAVLMYHAILDARGACAGADARYAVSSAAFRSQLASVARAGLQVASVRDVLDYGMAGRIAFTFDDGHSSNASAVREIANASGSADLFINPSNVGQANFLDWHELGELARAGISIQSHGYTHRYLNELTDPQIEQELASSKSEIECRIGMPVVLFAPPGGRLPRRVGNIAQRLGYRGICSSRVGLWVDGESPWLIPRIAVLDSTGDEQFQRWVAKEPREIARMRLRHAFLSVAKGLLGNAGYERFRTYLLAKASRWEGAQ